MKITLRSLYSFLPFLILFLSGGCVSTITEEPALNAKEAGGDEVVISVYGAAPIASALTKAGIDDFHAGHQLRYTAKLYKLESSKPAIYTDGSNRVQTIEQLANDGNRIVFKNVEDGQRYFVTIFADYIEEGVAKDAKGHYPDKYYTTPDGEGADAIKCIATQAQRFNNQNMDCFMLISESFVKGQNEGVEMQKQLKRIATRVQVVNTGGDVVALKNLTVSGLYLTDKYSYTGKSASLNSSPTTQQLEIADPEQGLLFCFYTLAVSESAIDSSAESGGFRFTLTPNEGYEFQKSAWEVGMGIRYVANTTYKIKGDLLLTTKVPSNVAKLSVSVDDNWQEDEKNVSE